MPFILERRHRLLHMRIFPAERNKRSIEHSLKQTMDLLSLPDYVIKEKDMGYSCRRRSYTPYDTTRIFLLQKVIGDLLKTRQVPILCQWEHRPDFKQALLALQQLKEKEEEAQRNQRWAQSSPSSWWSWQVFMVDVLFL